MEWKSVDRLIGEVKQKLSSQPKLAQMFENCYSDTLYKTVKPLENGDAYVITGDIPAMWLRDSAAQLRPYLIPAREDKELAELIAGVVRRQFFYINIDPYANAFNETASGACWAHDNTRMNDWLWERKYELDSLCYPVQLAWLLWKNTGCRSQFNDDFENGMDKILTLFFTEQKHEAQSAYSFQRENTFFTDTLSRGGKGALVKDGTGLIWSGFRPSDDACTYGYSIPSNMFAFVILGCLAEIAGDIYHNMQLKVEAMALRHGVGEGIKKYGILEKEGFGRIYAYEVDGFGQYLLMDDANIPSLLSAEYIGFPAEEEVMRNTRRFILSDDNPYYYKGSHAAGIGSPHTKVNYIWHLSLVMQAMTAGAQERQKILEVLQSTDAGTGLMHESFLADAPEHYTREWFSWANALFSELVLSVCGYRVLPANKRNFF